MGDVDNRRPYRLAGRPKVAASCPAALKPLNQPYDRHRSRKTRPRNAGLPTK